MSQVRNQAFVPGTHLPRAALIAGCGDIGLRVAQRLRAMGGELRGIVRSQQSAQTLRVEGMAAHIEDFDAVPGEIFPLTEPLVFWFAPPPGTGISDPRLRGFLARLTAPPQRLVYISTSGVYGDCGGRWIDEDEPVKPATDRARRRWDAEQALDAYAARTGCEVVVLRVPGIYGPGRLPVERLRQGLPLLRLDDAPWTNRIHAEDLADAAIHAAAFGVRGARYHVADGHPSTMTDYFLRCARLLDLPAPPQVSLEEARRTFTPAMWSFMEESRRLRVERMRDVLRFTPRYLDLDAGLAASR